MKIAISGGSGFVGRRLAQMLLAAGHSVRVLSRNPAAAQPAFADLPADRADRLSLTPYDPLDRQSWKEALTGCEGVVHLAGESLIGSRWTQKKKTEILQSRAQTTSKLVEAIGQMDSKPQVVVSASAIGYYGDRGDELLDESSPPADDFLARVCKEWEAAARPLANLGVRLVQVRIGIVLGPGGGALAQMLGPFQMFVGGPIGSGRQWTSWIHRDDLAGAIVYALTHDSVSGVINGTAPNPVKMATFCNILGQVIARPSWLPVPSIALELLLGEAAQIVLTGQRVLPKRTLEQGYQFQYPDLKLALQEILIGS
ncbi:TIGR01777 family oxidoreductase [Synechococcus sp. PCC 7336]|uniref:thylakoid membrane protein ThyD n=1 Tax=Synechococcus sp. PCC 7336 TaxID=195250 RepID=UPI00034A1ACB|nr:TIGR01777 family oxidoreductase [Synechococcus sp. PCC 7336]